MFRRVALIVVGIVIGLILREFFGVPRRLAAIIAFVPFALNEAKNLSGPYEKTAHEIMHEQSDEPMKPADKKSGAD
jgi:hypothetical protein